MNRMLNTFCLMISVVFFACQNNDVEIPDILEEMNEIVIEKIGPQVLGVSFTGSNNVYNFSVTIQSPDTGCDQYADWWEVFTADGELLYRRILAHSHVDEQPFTRSGGPVNVQDDTELIVRAHMNNLGYGTQVYRGSISRGFEEGLLDQSEFAGLALVEPLPGNCAF